MQENHLEQLDKMFPEGYIIVYTCKDSQVRMSLYNPNQYELIEKYHQLLKKESESNENTN